MADKQINELTQATAISSTDVLAIDRTAGTRKNTIGNFFNNGSEINYIIDGATITPNLISIPISKVVNLQTSLDSKASSSHNHSYNDLTDKPVIPEIVDVTNKLEASNIIAGDNITVSVDGNNVTIDGMAGGDGSTVADKFVGIVTMSADMTSVPIGAVVPNDIMTVIKGNASDITMSDIGTINFNVTGKQYLITYSIQVLFSSSTAYINIGTYDLGTDLQIGQNASAQPLTREDNISPPMPTWIKIDTNETSSINCRIYNGLSHLIVLHNGCRMLIQEV